MQEKRQPYKIEGHETAGGFQELGPASAKRQLQGNGCWWQPGAHSEVLLLSNSLDTSSLKPE